MSRIWLVILAVTTCTLGSQMLLKTAVRRVANAMPDLAGLRWMQQMLLAPEVWAAILLQGLGFMLWIVVVSKMKLGPAFAVSGAFFYIMLAMLDWVVFGERLNALQWVGLLMISGGVVAMVWASHGMAQG